MTFFRDAINFMETLGIYDVVLPFLLIFTIMYAILERTRLFATPIETDSGAEITPSNLHAMVAFSTALIAVASTQVISAINIMLSYVVLLTILIVMFLMLVANFRSAEELNDGKLLGEKWKKLLTFLVFIGIILIFVHSMGWYYTIVDFLSQIPTENLKEIGYSFVILVLMVVAIYYVIHGGNSDD